MDEADNIVIAGDRSTATGASIGAIGAIAAAE